MKIKKSTKKKAARPSLSKTAPKKEPSEAKAAVRARLSKKTASSGQVRKTASKKKKVASSRVVKKATVKRPAAKGKPASSSVRKTKSVAAAAKPTASKGAKAPSLNARQREGFKQLLLAMRDRLNASINSLKSESLATKDWINMEEDGTDIFDQQFALNIVTSENEMLIQIDEALTRIDTGTYGICEACECGINPERLKALPFVKNCIACQTQKEGRTRFSSDLAMDGFE